MRIEKTPRLDCGATEQPLCRIAHRERPRSRGRGAVQTYGRCRVIRRS